jgi:hypothetical protein
MKLFGLFSSFLAAIAATECEVCVTVITEMDRQIQEAGLTSDADIEKKIREICKPMKDQNNRFCYYTGLTADAATTMHTVCYFEGEYFIKNLDQTISHLSDVNFGN